MAASVKLAMSIILKGAVNMAQMYGYVRVSTKEQNEERQLVAMRKFGVMEGSIFLDKQSGKDFDRRAYQGYSTYSGHKQRG